MPTNCKSGIFLMTEPQILDVSGSMPEEPSSRSRNTLLRRLIDYVAMPSSRMAPQDRSMGGDILLEMLFHASQDERMLAARRLKNTSEAPRRVLRYLAQCSFEVARPLLEENESFDASDLCTIVEQVSPEHRMVIASRKSVPSTVGDRLVQVNELHVLKALLNNRHAEISEHAMDILVTRSRDDDSLCELIVKREELRPAQAMVMFWWAGAPTRRDILQRFAANRLEMIEMCSDVFAMAAAEGWSDAVSRKTLQLIERRQRNRAAIDKSPYDSLEHAIQVAEVSGMTTELSEEIGYLSGIKPVTIAKILEDQGGEGLAVVCKATGLKREYLTGLWTALRRATELENGEPSPLFEYVHETYDILTVAKAQTTLRYWNWSLSSTFSPTTVDAGVEEEVANDEAAFSAARRTARLVFGK